MSSLNNSYLSLLINTSCDSFNSFDQPHPPPNTPTFESKKPLSYAQTIGITNEQEINVLNAYEFGCYSPFLGAREEANGQLFYDSTEPHPLFPFIRNRTNLVSPTHLPHHTDQSPIGFTRKEWEKVWNTDEFKIDAYLTLSKAVHLDILLPWTNEHDYHGASYRLTISRENYYRKQTITHGTTITFRECNGPNYRYIVDHCVHEDYANAYLKVFCFNPSQHWYDVCSYRPPLILVVPKNHCNVRLHPHLTPIRNQPRQRTYTKTELEILDALLKGYHGKRTRSVWKRLFCC